LGFASCASFDEPLAACHLTPAPPSPEVLAAELEVAGAVDRRPMTASAPLALMLDFENSS
jgi:hypothetical protein